ncbi:MAG: hypothetical protein NVS4B7_00260 [Ktedonobacteraceae bacterium]
MQLQQHISFFEDDIPQDDIDKLFSHLQPMEPPPSFVLRILSQLPTNTTSASLVSQPVAWNRLDDWIIKNTRQKLC